MIILEIEDEIDENIENFELDKAVTLMLSKEKPQYAKTPAKQGICKWGNCDDRTYKSDAFCRIHWLKLKNDRYKIAKHLNIRCQFGDGSCENTLRYNNQYCIAHRDKTFESKNIQKMSDDEMKIEASNILKRFIEPIANSKIRYYIGRTPNLKRRLNIHIHELNVKGAMTENLKIEAVITVKGQNQANDMENLIINECAFSDSKMIRKMLINHSKFSKFLNFKN